MRGIVMWSLKVPATVAVLAVGVIIFGLTQLQHIAVDTLPEFGRTSVEVQTEALGLSAREVEQLVTVPLEQNLLNGVAFLEDIESASLPGLSSVVMTFEPGTDVLTARQVVTERLTQAAGMAGLVQVAKPPQMLQPRSSTSRAVMVRLSSPEQSLIELSVLARWVIVPRLLGVEGVANVAIWGFRDRQLQVTVDPAELRDHGVTLSQIVRTAGNALEVSPLSFLEASAPGTGGWIETVNQRLHIFHEQAITTPGELEQIPLEGPGGGEAPVDPEGGRILTLGDVSEVVEDHQPLVGDAYCLPPDEDCLLLVVEAFPDANTLEVTSGVDATLDAMRPALGAIQIDSSIYRPADHIETSFANTGRALAIGGVLLVLVLVAFFRRWRTVLLAAVAVPLPLVIAGLFLAVRGVTVNLMTVAGLVLALVVIVDDTVVGVEQVSSRLRQRGRGGDGAPPWQHAADATVETRRSLVYGTLVGLCAAVPLLFVGLNAVFLSPIVVSYVLAIGASLLVALTLTPALALVLMGEVRSETPDMAGRLEKGYGRIADRILPRHRPALLVGASLLALGLVALLLAETSLRPALAEGDVLAHVTAEAGTSLGRMDAVMAEAIDSIAAIEGVRNVGAHVGRAVASDQVVDVNSGDIWIKLEPAANREATLGAIESTLDRVPDVSSDLLTYSQERVAAHLQEPDEDRLVVRVYGEGTETLMATAEAVRGALTGIDGIEDPAVVMPPEESTIQVEVDLTSAQLHGVSPGDVRRAAAILLSGLTVGNLFEEQKVFDVVVWGQPEIRQSESDVRSLLIDTPDGGHVTLEEVADVRLASSPAVIRHHSVMTYRDVVAEVPEGVGSVAGAVGAAIDEVDFPLEYHAELLGGYTEQGAARARLFAVALAAAVAMFLLLQAAFESWRLATLVIMCLPAALAGGVVAALVTDGRVTLGTVAGLVGVMAIAARSMVVLVRGYQQHQRAGRLNFGGDVVVTATGQRIGPVLASAAATAFVLLPFVVAGDAVGFEILRPMVIALLGGLVTSIVVCLVVVPSLYLRFGRVHQPDPTTAELSGFTVARSPTTEVVGGLPQ